MNRQEFLETLGRALKRDLSDAEVMDNIQYYDNYIEEEIKCGKSEAQVLEQLGDPRLIAKTILQVEEQKEEPVYDSTETDASDDSRERYGGHVKVKQISKVKMWLLILAVLLILFFILKTAFTIVWKLLPILFVAGIVIGFYHKFIAK